MLNPIACSRPWSSGKMPVVPWPTQEQIEASPFSTDLHSPLFRRVQPSLSDTIVAFRDCQVAADTTHTQKYGSFTEACLGIKKYTVWAKIGSTETTSRPAGKWRTRGKSRLDLATKNQCCGLPGSICCMRRVANKDPATQP